MPWPQKIADCSFLLDYVQITILSDKPKLLVKQFSNYLTHKKTLPESKATRPKMKNKLKSRTYFTFGRIKKMYLIHGKIAAMHGIDALLYMHDVPLLELVQIELVLQKLPSISDFHFSAVEFRWDLSPKKGYSAVKLQKHLVRHLHLSSAQSAFSMGTEKRITYYINDRGSDIHSKVYIRPKRPNSKRAEFVRFELTARTDWLKRVNLVKPSDFKNFNYSRVVKQVKWLDIDWAKIRKIQPNILTGGLWRKYFDGYRDENGISDAIIEYRQNKMCPPHCKNKGHRRNCAWLKANQIGKTKNAVVRAIQQCPVSEQQRFARLYTRPSKFKRDINKILRDSYKMWWQYPLFPKLPAKTVFRSKSKLPATRKAKKVQSQPKVKLHNLFGQTMEN